MIIGRTLVWTVIIMTLTNLLALAIPSHAAQPLHHLLALISHWQFFTFSLTVACVLSQQWVVLLVALGLVGLATVQQPDFSLVRMVYAVGVGILTGLAFLAAIRESTPSWPPETVVPKNPHAKP